MRANIEELECGILVHQLPKDDMGKAAKRFSGSICRKTHDSSGMRVYFSRKESAEGSVRKRSIQLGGIAYNIYPLVTCLSVYGIHNSATKVVIEAFVRAAVKAPVLEVRQVSGTDDYRVVLDVPEVLANFDLPPISPTEDPDETFPMVFFCRLCREEGHKQYQCRRYESTQPQPTTTGTVNSGGTRDRVTTRRNGVPQSNSSTESQIMNSGVNQITETASRGKSIRGSSHTRALRKDCSNSNKSRRLKDVGLHEQNAQNPIPSSSRTSTAAERDMRDEQRREEERNPGTQATSQSSHTKSVKNKEPTGTYPCREIKNIILKTSGILSPDDMVSFLQRVRNKKKQVDIAMGFTRNIPELIEQLKGIISYHEKQRKTTPRARQDIRMIRDLCNRLENKMLQMSRLF